MPLKISRILHAGYVFECDDIQIAIDPIFENPFSRNCYAYPNISFDHDQIRKLKFAAIFISHYHDDHCSLESLNLLDRETPIYAYCLFEELFTLIRELGFTNVIPLEIDVPVNIGSLEIIPRRALDEDVDSIFQIKAQGLNVLNVVDSWIDSETLNLLSQNGPWNMVLWPFQTMREIEVIAPSRADPPPQELPPEWIEQLKVLKPRFVVPSSCQFIQESWSWYNHAFFPVTYRQFKQEIGSALPAAEIVRMNPSVSVVLNKNSVQPSSPLKWMTPTGEQDVDYEYKKDLKPPPTAEIAQHFPPLSGQQTKMVYDYCRTGLLEKYRSLECSADSFFEKPRLWRLSAYDNTGVGTHFYYLLDGSHIELTSEIGGQLSWTSEIPISKLYAALELGETLTSLYMRINDVVFDAETERDLATVDIVEDPLIRCLFTGVFGAYQTAQLKRIKGEKYI